MKNKGITLIALVITIVVLLILAAVSINGLLGDNGIFGTANRAKEEHNLSQERERLELAKTGPFMKNQGSITVDEYIDELIKKGITTKDDVTDLGDGSKELVTDSGYDVTVKPDPNSDNNIIIEVNGKADKLTAQIKDIKLKTDTTDSIEVTVEARRDEGATFTYYYKEADLEGATYQKVHEGKEKTYTITNLKSDTRYMIKVEAKNENGTVEKEVAGRTGTVLEAAGNVEFEDLQWENKKGSIVITTTTGYKISYRIDSGEWKTINSGDRTDGADHDGTIEIRLIDDSGNFGGTTTYTMKDTGAPDVTITPGDITTNSISITASATDDEWGMPETITYHYYIREHTTGDVWPAETTNNTTGSYTFESLKTGTYDVKVETNDKAGVVGSNKIENITTEPVTTAAGNVGFENVQWENRKGSVVITTTTGYKISYKIAGGDWKTINSGDRTDGVDHDGIIEIRLIDDSGNFGGTTTYTMKDTGAPDVTITRGEITSNSISITASATDAEWGMPDTITYHYYIREHTTEDVWPEETTNNTTGVCKFEGLKEKTMYDIKVETYDKAEVKGEKIIENEETLEIPKNAIAKEYGKIQDDNKNITEGDKTLTIPAGFQLVDPNDDPTVEYKDYYNPTIDEGIVIQDGVGNEFVWIPVPEINDMVRCKDHLNSTITYNEATKKFTCSGQEGEEPTLVGKLYDFSGTGATSTSTPKTEIDTYREPDTLSSYDGKDEYKTILGVDSIDTFKTQLQNEFNDLVKSVNKYKGFYIGRYETGALSSTDKNTTPKVQKEQTTGNANWYYQYMETKNISLNNTDKVQKSVTSSMIWGSQWDATLNWFLRYEDTKGYVTDSTGKGNYTGDIKPTGYYQVKNIYDMAGNAYDWTIEAYSTNSRVNRGGIYGNSGSGYPASYRGYSVPSYSSTYGGSRSTLIVNL